jgi:hypothetical protein
MEEKEAAVAVILEATAMEAAVAGKAEIPARQAMAHHHQYHRRLAAR